MPSRCSVFIVATGRWISSPVPVNIDCGPARSRCSAGGLATFADDPPLQAASSAAATAASAAKAQRIKSTRTRHRAEQATSKAKTVTARLDASCGY